MKRVEDLDKLREKAGLELSQTGHKYYTSLEDVKNMDNKIAELKKVCTEIKLKLYLNFSQLSVGAFSTPAKRTQKLRPKAHGSCDAGVCAQCLRNSLPSPSVHIQQRHSGSSRRTCTRRCVLIEICTRRT